MTLYLLLFPVSKIFKWRNARYRNMVTTFNAYGIFSIIAEVLLQGRHAKHANFMLIRHLAVSPSLLTHMFNHESGWVKLFYHNRPVFENQLTQLVEVLIKSDRESFINNFGLKLSNP